MDEIRLQPEKAVEAIKDPTRMLNAFIEYHRKRGKDDRWIRMRFDTIIRRNEFTNALNEFVSDTLTRRHYAIATDDEYLGLWGRTTATLKKELDVPGKETLRDYQPTLALYYQGIVEEVCAQKFGQREEVTWGEAREIIQRMSALIGRQAKELGDELQQDIATGRPLLTAP